MSMAGVVIGWLKSEVGKIVPISLKSTICREMSDSLSFVHCVRGGVVRGVVRRYGVSHAQREGKVCFSLPSKTCTQFVAVLGTQWLCAGS